MRLQFTEAGLISSEVIASSTASATVNQIGPPGVAVNPQGTVVTTLPIPNSDATGNFNTVVAFSDDIVPQQFNVGAFAPIVTGLDASSNGLTTDAFGNFFIATNTVGSSLGGFSGAGTVLVFDPNLAFVDALPAGGGQVDFGTNDVAVSPDGSSLFATFSSGFFDPLGGFNGGVLLFSTAEIGSGVAAANTAPINSSSFVAQSLDESNQTEFSSIEIDPLTGSPLGTSIVVSDTEQSLTLGAESTGEFENIDNSNFSPVFDSGLGISSSIEISMNPEELGIDPLSSLGTNFDSPDSMALTEI